MAFFTNSNMRFLRSYFSTVTPRPLPPKSLSSFQRTPVGGGLPWLTNSQAFREPLGGRGGFPGWISVFSYNTACFCTLPTTHTFAKPHSHRNSLNQSLFLVFPIFLLNFSLNFSKISEEGQWTGRTNPDQLGWPCVVEELMSFLL